MFFDNQVYFDFVKYCRESEITVPITPGLKPISTKSQISRLPQIFNIDLPEDLGEKVRAIKSHTSLPVVVGFGISNNDMTRKILQVADGFVVGSYLVDAIGSGKSAKELTQLTRGLVP